MHRFISEKKITKEVEEAAETGNTVLAYLLYSEKIKT